ncbi:MAG: radical SAM protein [Actinobacteria bacterium]|nr:radical SAM protein [Actinomycetota bacterium]
MRCIQVWWLVRFGQQSVWDGVGGAVRPWSRGTCLRTGHEASAESEVDRVAFASFPPASSDDSSVADGGLVIGRGKLGTEAVEINAAWHCNISCSWCSHGSPELPPRFADESVVGRDLRCLARWLRVDHVRVLGGEPLVHPRLPHLLQLVRESAYRFHRKSIATSANGSRRLTVCQSKNAQSFPISGVPWRHRPN